MKRSYSFYDSTTQSREKNKFYAQGLFKLSLI